jgi:Mycothiol maleylpyruvate isomerase N-terminal domain
LTDRKSELFRLEDRSWAELRSLIDQLTDEQLRLDGYYPEWSVKDLMAHYASWMAEASRMLEQIRLGSYTEWDQDVDACNADWYASWRELDLGSVKAHLYASRYRMLEEWDRLPPDLVDGKATEWFRDSGVDHNADHVPRLREWVAALRGPSPSRF